MTGKTHLMIKLTPSWQLPLRGDGDRYSSRTRWRSQELADRSWNNVGTLRCDKDEVIRESLLRADNLPHHITQALLKPSYSACDVNTDDMM